MQQLQALGFGPVRAVSHQTALLHFQRARQMEDGKGTVDKRCLLARSGRQLTPLAVAKIATCQWEMSGFNRYVSSNRIRGDVMLSS